VGAREVGNGEGKEEGREARVPKGKERTGTRSRSRSRCVFQILQNFKFIYLQFKIKFYHLGSLGLGTKKNLASACFR
jgi:hypothetical protein